jgi:hypothetical protein
MEAVQGQLSLRIQDLGLQPEPPCFGLTIPSTEKQAMETFAILTQGKRACEQRLTFGKEQNSTTCRKL